ncbi:MAG: aldehyde dehydrogenase family protein [Gemmatimonadaceae bacterium]|jgi:succinate-semialdehyde dehydrogenase/glutarate-semialdehyde dehydrogenase|nr:aldehyde dehydrogenase family protein [Gemmatimonadaceae bacterium]
MAGAILVHAPHGGELLGEYARQEAHEVNAALATAAAAQRAWREVEVTRRAQALRALARVLRERRDDLAVLAVREMAKPITQARGEVEKCAACCDWYADRTALLDPARGPEDGDEVRLAPLGVVFAIMPWNFPYWQVVRVLAPALLLGNAVALKHAEQVTGCALALHDAVAAAGIDAALFPVLRIDHDAAAQVIASPHVAAVTLTGSDRAGATVAALAGRALKPVVLELGGSDPFIVWHDVDIDAVADAAAGARCLNNGQSCIAAKRFLVHADVHDPFLEAFTAAMARRRVGDPRDERTDVGPLVTPAARDGVREQVQRTLDAGARAVLGGVPPVHHVPWCPPGVVVDIPDGTPLADDELFAPVAGVWRVRDLDDAVRRANGTRFGLGASVWTHDAAIARAFAQRLDAGSVMINRPVASDPALPFGGVKASGHGRELGDAGLRAFANVRTVRGLMR